MKNSLILIQLCFVIILKSQTVSNYSINGVFVNTQTKYFENGQLKNNNSVAAYFSYNSVLQIQANALDKVTSVKFNGIKLKQNTQKKLYSKSEKVDNSNHDDEDENDEECNALNFNSKHWVIKGKNEIPDMNFMYNGILPSFDAQTIILKDTLKKTDTLFITINNIQNADSILISFADDDQLSTRHFCAFQAPNYSNTYYIPPSVFNPLAIGPRGFIQVKAINYNYQTIAGKQFLFRNIFNFVRQNVRIIN